MQFFKKAAFFVLFLVVLCQNLRFDMLQELVFIPLSSSETTRTTTVMLGPKYPHHAIVIPYRERLDNARDFITFMGSYLTRNFPNETFSAYFVVQVDSDFSVGGSYSI